VKKSSKYSGTSGLIEMWKRKERALKERRSSYSKEGGDGSRTSEDSEDKLASKKMTMGDGKKSFGPPPPAAAAAAAGWYIS